MTFKAILLGAGRGSRLGTETENKPKALVKFGNRSLLAWQIEALTQAGIQDLTLVTGYCPAAFDTCFSGTTIHNAKWQTTNMLYSLSLASDTCSVDNCIISYTDIFYPTTIIKNLMQAEGDIVISYDLDWLQLWSRRSQNPLEDAETFRITKEGLLLEIGNKPSCVDEVEGQYMGLIKLTPNGHKIWNEHFINLTEEQKFKFDITKFLKLLLKLGVKINTIPTEEKWGEIDTPSDLKLYEEMIDTGYFSWYKTVPTNFKPLVE